MTSSCRDFTKTACVFGGTGFIGKYIVEALAKDGYRVKVATRIPESAFFLKTYGSVGQIMPYACDYTAEGIDAAVKGADVVVNCIGILYEKGKSKFQRAHVDIPEMIAKACEAHGVERFIHISALACNRGNSKYAHTKYAGEQAVMQNFENATILRPSIVFGPDDSFFNMFASLSLILPALPLIGGGKTKFQPVYVCDVRDAVMAALHNDETAGEVFELAGPQTYSFKELFEMMFESTRRKRCLITLPWWLATVEGTLMELWPKPLLTRDQVKSLRTDNITHDDAPGLAALGITPKAPETILPTYLYRYAPGGQAAQD